MRVTGIHHLALVTNSLDRTIRFWRDLVGLELRARLGAPGYRQYFFAAGDRVLIAFFEWDGAEPVPEKDHGAPVRAPIVFDHVAFEVEGDEDLFALRDRLEAAGFWVSEPTDLGFAHSIFSFDPNGVPVEFAVAVRGNDFRERPLFADRSPGSLALEGPLPRPGVWPEPPPPPPAAERRIYPGLGSEYFHGVKK